LQRSWSRISSDTVAGADEDRTKSRPRTLRSDLIDPAVDAHNGRIVKRTGDGRIIKFRSVVDAVRCAIEVQNGMADRNAGLPEAGKAVAEMRRVVRPGGVVAAVVWDHLGGMPGMRMMVDTVAALSEGGRQLRSRFCFQPMMQPGEMKQTFIEQRLADVGETELMIRMDYLNFDDYWAPIGAGEGPLGKYMAKLDAAERVRTDAAVRDAYAAGRPDGPRSFASVAWACRGIVP